MNLLAAPVARSPTGINFRHFDEIEAPEIYRQAIRNAVSAATGLPVK
jgi:hypothetical protein